MNQIIDQILQNWGEFNQVKKLLKTQIVRNHPFHIDQKFQIIDKVGKGSYSIVVAAICKDPVCLKSNSTHQQREQNCKHMIAIKKMQNIFPHTTYTKKALRQLRGYRLMKHPNILLLHTIQLPPSKQDFHEIYCMFELMDTNLQKVLQQCEQDLNEQHWKFFLYQILRALKYMHSAGMIHGNISTKACLVNDICDLKLCQFSQITLISNPNRLGILYEQFDKIHNPAPELLLKDKQFTTSIDVWSAGCVFAQLINRRPFLTKSNQLLLQTYCDYLGNPNEKSFKHLDEEGRSQIKKLQKYKHQPKDFKKLFPQLSDKGIDLMKKMLIFQSQNRITAQAALRHPYFTQLHSDQYEPRRQHNYDLNFEFEFQNFNLTTVEFKQLLFQEILLYHSVALRNQHDKKVKKNQSLMGHIVKQQQLKNKNGQTLDSYIQNLIDKGIRKQQKMFTHSNFLQVPSQSNRKKYH